MKTSAYCNHFNHCQSPTNPGIWMPPTLENLISVCVITKQTATSGRGFIVSLAHSGYRDMLPRPQKNKLCFSESDFPADSKATL